MLQNDLTLLAQQQQLGRLIFIGLSELQQQRLAQQYQQLQSLKQRPKNYLNRYDQLFRLVSIWLLKQGWDFTQFQPHQVLQEVMELLCPNTQAYRVVQHRHRLKKKICLRPDAVAEQDLKIMQHHLRQLLQLDQDMDNMRAG